MSNFTLRTSISTKSFVTESILLLLSTVTLQLSRFIASLVVAKWTGPEEFGVWNFLNLFLLYSALTTLGLPNGMNRDVPLLMGQGDFVKSEQIVGVSFWFVLVSSIVTGLIISTAAISGLSYEYRYPLLWMGFLFATWQVYQFLQFYLKCHFRFHTMIVQQFIFAILLPIITLPLAYTWGISGFILGQATAILGINIFIIKATLFKVKLTWNSGDFISLMKTGLPIMIAGLLYSLLTSMDRWVILKFLDLEALGHYTLAILCLSILSLLPSVVAQQMYPRMAFRYGQTWNKHSLLPLVIWQSLAGAIATLPILIFVYFALPSFVNYFLPAYSYGVEPARYLLIGLAFMSLSGGIANFLNTTGKHVLYLFILIGSILANLGLNIFLIHIGLGLNGAALGSSISYILYTLTLILACWLTMSKD